MVYLPALIAFDITRYANTVIVVHAANILQSGVPEATLLSPMRWMWFSAVVDSDGGVVTARPKSGKLMVTGRLYVPNRYTKKKLLQVMRKHIKQRDCYRQRLIIRIKMTSQYFANVYGDELPTTFVHKDMLFWSHF